MAETRRRWNCGALLLQRWFRNYLLQFLYLLSTCLHSRTAISTTFTGVLPNWTCDIPFDRSHRFSCGNTLMTFSSDYAISIWIFCSLNMRFMSFKDSLSVYWRVFVFSFYPSSLVCLGFSIGFDCPEDCFLFRSWIWGWWDVGFVMFSFRTTNFHSFYFTHLFGHF